METAKPSRNPVPRARRGQGPGEPGAREPVTGAPGGPAAPGSGPAPGPAPSLPAPGPASERSLPARSSPRGRPSPPAAGTRVPAVPSSPAAGTRVPAAPDPPAAGTRVPAAPDPPAAGTRVPAAPDPPAAGTRVPAAPDPPSGWGGLPADPQPDMILPRVKVSGPSDILAVVPHLMGFHPRLSFVVIGAAGPRRRVELGFRYDLPDPPGAAAAAEIADHAVAVLAQRAGRHGHRDRLRSRAARHPGRGRVRRRGARRRRLQLRELLRVEDGRYWSYLCGNPAAAPRTARRSTTSPTRWPRP